MTANRAGSSVIRTRCLTVLGVLALLSSASSAADWLQWGRDATRNAVSPEKDLPIDFDLPVTWDGKPVRNSAWIAELGSSTIVPPVVADGLVWVCTKARNPNDDESKIPEQDWDGGMLMCFREADGKLLWKKRTPRLTDPNAQDEDGLSLTIGNAPLVERDRLWYVNNRSEVVCLDIAPLKNGTGEPREVWTLDLRRQYNVYAKLNGCIIMPVGFAPSVAGYKDWLFVGTRNSADDSQVNPPNRLARFGRDMGWWKIQDKVHVRSPEAPSLVCLDKTTGKLVWKDNSPGDGILQYQQSSPLVVEVEGKPQVIVGQGDGWLRSFEAATGKLIWKCDLNSKDARWELNSSDTCTRNYVVATPVSYEGRVYIATGQDYENFIGPGTLFCIDPTKTGDVSLELEDGPKKGKPNPNSAVVWHTPRKPPVDAPKLVTGSGKNKRDLYQDRGYFVGRMTASVTVHDGLLYAAELGGYLHCFDAKTGKLYWLDNLESCIFGQPLWVDGKVVVTTEADVFLYAHGKERNRIKKWESSTGFRAGAIFANGTLYVTGHDKLYAFRKPK